MTHLLDLPRLALLPLTCALLFAGCDAPEKNVGQETEGESSSGSTTGGASESDSESDSDPGTESDSASATSTSTTTGGSESDSETSGASATAGESTGAETTGGAPGLPDGFEDGLSSAGCADMAIFGDTDDGSIGFVLSTGPDFNPVADAVAAGETTTTVHDVSEFSRLAVLVGDNVTYPECNDALDPDAYSIEQEWVATAGSISVEIVPEMDPPKFSTQGYATITVTGLEVTYDGVTESVGEFTLSDIAVGWLPG